MKYLNRIYTLKKLGISLSKEDNTIVDEIDRIVSLLNSFEYMKSHNGNSFFYTESKLYIEYQKEYETLTVYDNLTNFKNKEDIIKFISNNILGLHTECLKVNVNNPKGHYQTFKQYYL